MEQDYKAEMRAMTEGLAEWCRRRERRGQTVRRVLAVALMTVTLSTLAMTVSHDFRRAVFHPKNEPPREQPPAAPPAAEQPPVVCDTVPVALDTTPAQAAVPEIAETVLPEPAPRYDFAVATPQGDTLFCTVTRVARSVSVSVQGSAMHPAGTLALPAVVEHEGLRYEVTALADSAFANCRELRRITLPPTISFIGRDAFNGCSALDTVVALAAQPPEIVGEWCFWEVPQEAVLMVTCRSGVAYRSAHCWDYFDTVVDTCEVPRSSLVPRATIRVNGNYLIVEDVYGETVRVYDIEGRLIASEQCNGRCQISIGGGRHFHNTSAFLVQVGDGPVVKVSASLRSNAPFGDTYRYWGNGW